MDTQYEKSTQYNGHTVWQEYIIKWTHSMTRVHNKMDTQYEKSTQYNGHTVWQVYTI